MQPDLSRALSIPMLAKIGKDRENTGKFPISPGNEVLLICVTLWKSLNPSPGFSIIIVLLDCHSWMALSVDMLTAGNGFNGLEEEHEG